MNNKFVFIKILTIVFFLTCGYGTVNAIDDSDKLPFDEDQVDSSSKARIYLSEKKFDFGKIKEGIVVKHIFKIKNIGKDVLKIKRVRASCGCTAALPKKKKLKSGEETNLVVEFDTSGREGKQKKSVYIYTNDPTSPKMKIQFTALIEDK
jgi:hypothetical protein